MNKFDILGLLSFLEYHPVISTPILILRIFPYLKPLWDIRLKFSRNSQSKDFTKTQVNFFYQKLFNFSNMGLNLYKKFIIRFIILFNVTIILFLVGLSTNYGQEDKIHGRRLCFRV